MSVFWEILKEQGNAGNYRLFTAAVTDLSRISYFLLGIEHLIAKPFGNVLIYTADTDLQNYHNTFLTIANRNGIIACSLFIAVVLFSFIKSIAHLKDNCVVGNSARGDVVNDEAMIKALKSEKVFAYGLDVYNGEPKIHPEYLKLKNIFLLPHLGSATKRTRWDMLYRATKNLEMFFNGKKPQDLVN